MSVRKPELMAPAGSMPALKAALAAGADAVYLGGKQFSARQSAQNFDSEELKQAIRLAHRVGAKVYVTVNTLQQSTELPAAVQFLGEIYNLGADAAILQDPGLIATARLAVPGLELHASTQLTIHNAAGVQAMEQLGIKRVVLARELAADQIRQIRQSTSIGLEVFLHGALCVAYSGQCLLSSLTGGRSGNRGQCAQVCRLPYQLANGRAVGHLQSPRDLCLYPELTRLLPLGLDALKIEGRLKRPAYVATVVGYYRQAIDCFCSGRPLPDWQDVQADLLQVFNRGFTRGYFLGKPGVELLTVGQPGHQGLTIGRVQPSGKLDLWHDLQVGDVLQAPDGSEYRVQQNGRPTALPGMTLAPGQPLQRLQSAAIEQLATELVENFEPEAIPVDWRARLLENGRLELWATAGAQTAYASGERTAELAINRPLDQVLVERQLQKSGDTGFCFGSLQADICPGLSLPVSEINLCRRNALDALAELLWGQPQPDKAEINLPNPLECALPAGQTRLAVAVSTADTLLAALDFTIDRVYFGSDWHQSHSPVVVLQAYAAARQLTKASGISCYLRLPRILHPEEETAWQAALADAAVEGLFVSNWGGVTFARRLQLPFVLGTAMNAYNNYFLSALPDAEAYYLSSELNRAETLALLSTQGQFAAVEIHAHHLLMVHEQCLLGANKHCLSSGRGCNQAGDYLVDRKGYRFPLRGDATCRSYLYNSQVFSLIDQTKELSSRHPAKELLIDLQLESRERASQILHCYQAAWQGFTETNQRDRLQSLIPEGITRGHWRRGV